MIRYKIKTGKAELNSTSGNHLCGLILSDTNQDAVPDNFQKRRSDAISDRDILYTQIGLLCNGCTDFNDIELYKGDSIFMNAYGLKNVASEAVFRQRFDDLPETRTHAALRQLNLQLLAPRSFGTVSADGLSLIPVDLDVSPLDNSGSSKQGVSFTYKKHDGYAPMFAYIGCEGYMLDCELRPGKQHCQSGTPDFIRRIVEFIERLNLKEKMLFRLDSGNDAAENYDLFSEHYFIAKRNLRKEVREQWLALARRVGTKQKCRNGKNIYTGFVDHLHPGGDTNRPCLPAVFEVIERITDFNGQALLIPEIEVNMWWTNLPCSAETVIELYHNHGTSEQFHSELKSDMDVERLPSGKLCANKIILLCAMISFNLLRSIGQEVVKRSSLAPQKITVSRWRIKTVLKNIIYCACRVVRHAGSIELQFGKRCPWFDVIKDICHAYA
ncbi:MAG: IS1380 family transposase [Spartobacteria bacterium]|nr:IS1380 family transposase [Spartobacteria bacterium]